MLQIAFIRENQEKVIKALAKRSIDATSIVQEVVQLDEKRRATQVALDTILSESNNISKEIGDLMKSGEKEKATTLKEQIAKNKEKTKELSEITEALAKDLLDKISSIFKPIASLPPKTVPNFLALTFSVILA